MPAPLQLKALEPIARGNLRLVFEHPENRALLVKVMRPEAVESRYADTRPWYKKRRRFSAYLLFAREVHEFVAAHAAGGRALPIAQEISGLVETDMGLGLVTPALRGDDGNLAPTLAHLINRDIFTAEAKTELETFLTGLLESPLVVSDLHERNLVYARHPGTGCHRFVMIDGIGAPTFMPFKVWFPALNRRSKISRIKRLRNRLALRESRRIAGETD